MKVAEASVVLLITCAVFGNSIGPFKMLLVVSSLFFGTCVVFSSPVERRYSNQEPRDLDFQDHLAFQDDSLAFEERGSRECTYDGESYEKGTLLNITSKGECYLYKCIRKKFRKMSKEIIQYCDEPCEMGWLPGCCMCKRKSCEEHKKAGETWAQVKKLTGPNRGICSLCECGADGNEYCDDNQFLCFKIPGCQETEKEPMPDSCCPKCKIWEKSTKATTQPWRTIPITLTTEGTTDPFTFPPGFDSSEDENR